MTHTKTFAMGETLRIVGGEHDGRLGTVVEVPPAYKGDDGVRLYVEAEAGQPPGPPVTTVENGVTVTRSAGGRGGRGGFLATLDRFELERVR